MLVLLHAFRIKTSIKFEIFSKNLVIGGDTGLEISLETLKNQLREIMSYSCGRNVFGVQVYL